MLDKPRQGSLTEYRKDDTIVLILGQVGSGKSTFLNRAAGGTVMTVGHNLTSETKSVSYCVLQDPTQTSRRYIFVDTPGFDDYKTEDREILDRIVKWIKDS
ncbi:hypothetical protein C0991_006811 [Blastosporella zonata]|nr:hypothetical protein C0991_006811 [Blastosporella zonata]